ncbi:putative O-acetyl-ADP-ribose deacetylase MACROD2 [Scophthalmus maximus]|uniref:Putative O-acetyl-ADP-ribose deacetylase MACROD2 n=1 Tax=Scophthalmus maximus TaxID=52904 RepID=A0A2U9CH77_SCOMX|nr:putative O-acetyl-ADP-ribose deacetylase MACROD2 [Scophthalmus maximus]
MFSIGGSLQPSEAKNGEGVVRVARGVGLPYRLDNVSEINEPGTSNGEEMKDHVESSEEPDSIPTDSNQSKAYCYSASPSSSQFSPKSVSISLSQ